MLQNIKWLFSNVNLLTVSVLVLYPFLLLFLLFGYMNNYEIGSTEIILFVLGYYGSNISVGVGLHRLWSHNSFKTNKVVEFILAVIAAGTLQGPALSWVSNHYKHHTFTDQAEDPHSPLKYSNPILGFLWSHIGWMLIGEGSYKSISKVTMAKLGRNAILKWQMKYYWQLAVFMNVIAPSILGYCIGGDLTSAYMGFLFIGLGRALQQNATFCVNSLCHFVGERRYYNGTARDIWWMAPFILGENWHNFHHAFPSDYRNGSRWYQADVHKWIIYLMSKLGLAWDLDTTPEVRIQARVNETMRQSVELRKHRIETMQDKVQQMLDSIYTKLSGADTILAVRTQLKKSFVDSQESLIKLTEQFGSLQLQDCSSEKILDMLSNKINRIELSICRLYQQLEEANS